MKDECHFSDPAGVKVRGINICTAWRQAVCWFHHELHACLQAREQQPYHITPWRLWEQACWLCCHIDGSHGCLAVLVMGSLPEDECMCLYFCSTTAKPGVSPRGHMTTHRKWGVHRQCSNSMASIKFMPADPYTSLYGDSIISAWGWYEEGSVVGLSLSTGQHRGCVLNIFSPSETENMSNVYLHQMGICSVKRLLSLRWIYVILCLAFKKALAQNSHDKGTSGVHSAQPVWFEFRCLVELIFTRTVLTKVAL